MSATKTRRTRAEWQADTGEETPPAPVSAPEVWARPATAEETPRGAKALRKFAELHGWKADVRYARGTRDGRPPRVVGTVSVRLRRDGVRAWAVWADGKFDAAQIWYPGGVPQGVNVTTLREHMAQVVDGVEPAEVAA